MGSLIRQYLMQGLGDPLGEAVLVIWELLHAWPCLHIGRAQQAKDLEDLIDLLHTATAQLFKSCCSASQAPGAQQPFGGDFCRA